MIDSKRALFLALLILFIITGCNEPVEQKAHSLLPEVEVQVQTLAFSTMPVQVELSGTLQAIEHATISARVAGQVVKLPVQIGSQVNTGDLLVKISAEEINARVRQAEIQLAQDRRNLARETKLFEVNASTREMVKTLKEKVQISEATLREVQAMLAYTEITAPFTGIITDKRVEVGDLATAGAALLKLEKDAGFEVVIQVPEAQAQKLGFGSRLPLTVPAAGLALEAEVREISPTVDAASRTTQVKLKLPDSEVLRSGQFARVGLVDSRSTTMLVPRTALMTNGQMQQVFVAEQDTARMRLVRTGTEYDEKIEILTGLRVGDRVILDPPPNLRDGQPLLIADGSKQ